MLKFLNLFLIIHNIIIYRIDLTIIIKFKEFLELSGLI